MSNYKRYIPNALTIARLLMAVLFFYLLSIYSYPITKPIAADLAIAIFIIATLSDIIDGHLARKWQVTSTFGRIMDPVCDKVLIIGAFIFMTGPSFITQTSHFINPGSSGNITGEYTQQFTTITGVEPWMVAIILVREILITGLRSTLEKQNIEFGAAWAGKMKMILQSIAIPIILILVAHAQPDVNIWAYKLCRVIIYLTVLVTVISGIPYILRAVTLSKHKQV